MARPIAQTVEQNNPWGAPLIQGYGFEDLPEGFIEVPDVVFGMVNRLPRSQVPQGSGRVVQNGRIRDDWTGRRPGTDEFGPTKPNSVPVFALITFITEAQDFYLCRVSRTGFHVLDAAQAAWRSYSILDEDGNSTTLPAFRTGYTAAQFFDKLYLANGVNKLLEVDFSAETVSEIAGSPRAKFITTFGDRVVAFNVKMKVGGLRAAGVQWPVNGDPTNWTGIGSGFEDLASTEIGDEITGAFGFEDACLVLRRKSFLYLTRQPFADAPFRFSPSVKGIGCDLPYGGARVPGGVIFPDQHTREVYFLSPGSAPQPIAGAINRELFEDLEDVRYSQGAFDPYEKEYHLGLVTEDGNENITKTWVCAVERNFSWGYDDSPEISTIGLVSLPGVSVSIDNLSGTIDAQTGTIDGYGDPGGFRPTLFKGTDTGEVLEQSFDYDDDWDATEFDFIFSSPNLASLSRKRVIKDLYVNVLATVTGSFTLEESRDEATWRNTKTATVTGAAVKQPLRLPKTQLEGKDGLFWRLTTNAPQLQIHSWFARVMDKGLLQG